MALINGSAHVSANAVYLAKGEEIFSRPQQGVFRAFTDVVENPGAELGIEMFGALPAPRMLTGTRATASMRAMVAKAEVREYTSLKLAISRTRVDGDTTGAMARHLARYLEQHASFWDSIVSNFLLSNPVGIDGVSLLNDSHPFGPNGATWDNKTTDPLSYSSFRAAYTAMTSLLDESGQPLGIRPTHLMVGPLLEPVAREVVGGARPYLFDNTGAEASASVVGGVALPNVLGGAVEIIVNPYMTDGDEWLLMDLSKPGAMPVILGEQAAPKAVALTDDRDHGVVERGEYEYYVSARGALVGGIPHVIYGRLD